MWEIAEVDPSTVRYLTDDGKETISHHFFGSSFEGGLEDFVARYTQTLLSEKGECNECEFFNHCGGYFKWPNKSYDCHGIKRLFRTLEAAADELKNDLAACEVMEAQLKP